MTATPTPTTADPVLSDDSQSGSIRGKVEYREGDGTNIAIRPGPVTVQLTTVDATLSWDDGKTRGSAAMPIGDFRNYVKQGAITLDA